jgi:hypothetical protein
MPDASTDTPSQARGRCYCGAVRFTAEIPPRFVCHCHCDNCRRAHGAAFVTWAGFLGERLRIDTGRERLVRFATDTGATRSFCGTCGSTLFYESPRWPSDVHVAAVHFEDPLGRAPAGHFYSDRAVSWCPILDELPRYGGEDGGQPL